MDTYNKNLRNFAAEQNEDENFILSEGTANEFCDRLDDDQIEFFQQVNNLAEQKKKWLRMVEKMQRCIENREFDEACKLLELLMIEAS